MFDEMMRKPNFFFSHNIPMANFGVFHYIISAIINYLFMKSEHYIGGELDSTSTYL